MSSRLHTAHARAGVPLALLLTLALTAVLAGCGGSDGNGVASKSPTEILSASMAAAQGASSVHVVGNSTVGRLSATSDLQLTSNGGRAQVSLLGLAFEIIRIGNVLYVKGNLAFDERLHAITGANVPQGAWLKALVTDGALAQLVGFTNLRSELRFLLTHATPPTKGATTTLGRRQAIALNETGRLYSGSLYVATTGKPYPIEIVKHGKETGHTTFTAWNQPVSLSAPSNVQTLKG